MSFQQALQHFNELCRQYQARQLSNEQFRQAVEQLRVQDGGGIWWQLSPQGQWLSWNGAAWMPGNPPETAPAPQPSPQQAPQPGAQLNAEAARQAVQHAQAAYGAVKTMAEANPAAIAGKVAGALTPLAGKSQKWWNFVSILGGGVGGGLWYWYSSMDKQARPDLITSLIMLAVPVVVVLLRKPIDGVLVALDPIRRKIPRLVIVGIGVAAPYLTATFLYDSVRIQEYPFIRWSVFLGPLLSYLIIRTPEMPSKASYPNQSGRS